jgi:hypothetical protein
VADLWRLAVMEDGLVRAGATGEQRNGGNHN